MAPKYVENNWVDDPQARSHCAQDSWVSPTEDDYCTVKAQTVRHFYSKSSKKSIDHTPRKQTPITLLTLRTSSYMDVRRDSDVTTVLTLGYGSESGLSGSSDSVVRILYSIASCETTSDAQGVDSRHGTARRPGDRSVEKVLVVDRGVIFDGDCGAEAEVYPPASTESPLQLFRSSQNRCLLAVLKVLYILCVRLCQCNEPLSRAGSFVIPTGRKRNDELSKAKTVQLKRRVSGPSWPLCDTQFQETAKEKVELIFNDTTWKKKGTTGRTIGEAMQWIIRERTLRFIYRWRWRCGHSTALAVIRMKNEEAISGS
ncbi:hypothetical protein T07_6622 [Trichinella nelsoni]|uniref:Uncharacterized protein n=1 Tax=Trichinella nelsoni TaxID=6336 RepID=A0A0V0SFD8_9BILA|nr:hypothetical protein T07_6622 [Trichinella nelsoni]